VCNKWTRSRVLPLSTAQNLPVKVHLGISSGGGGTHGLHGCKAMARRRVRECEAQNNYAMKYMCLDSQVLC
jgi:hypothetical protein